MIERGLTVEGACTVESPMGELSVRFDDRGTCVVPSGPVTMLRALLWLASGRRRRAARMAVRRLAAVTCRPVRLRLAPGIHATVAR